MTTHDKSVQFSIKVRQNCSHLCEDNHFSTDTIDGGPDRTKKLSTTSQQGDEIGLVFCQAQPQPQLQLSWAELVLVPVDPSVHPQE